MAFDFVNDRVEVGVADIVGLLEPSLLYDNTAVVFGVRVEALKLLCEVMLSEVSFNESDPSLHSTNSVVPLPLHSFKIGTLEVVTRDRLGTLKTDLVWAQSLNA